MNTQNLPSEEELQQFDNFVRSSHEAIHQQLVRRTKSPDPIILDDIKSPDTALVTPMRDQEYMDYFVRIVAGSTNAFPDSSTLEINFEIQPPK